jgi:hypothetical protein
MECGIVYPTRHFGSWCKCSRVKGHSGDHRYWYEGERGTVEIKWPNTEDK